MNAPNIETLYQELMSKIDHLNTVWNDCHKGESLSHFDGFSQFYYLESTLIGEAIEVVKLLYSNEPHEDFTNKIYRIKNDFDQLNNCFHEYLMHTPDDISRIAYYIEGFFRGYADGHPLTEEDLIGNINFIKTSFKMFFPE